MERGIALSDSVLALPEPEMRAGIRAMTDEQLKAFAQDLHVMVREEKADNPIRFYVPVSDEICKTWVQLLSDSSRQIQVPEGELLGATVHHVSSCRQTLDCGFSPVFTETEIGSRTSTVSWATRLRSIATSSRRSGPMSSSSRVAK